MSSRPAQQEMLKEFLQGEEWYEMEIKGTKSSRNGKYRYKKASLLLKNSLK